MGGNGSVQGENTSKLSESMANDVTSKLTDGQDFDDIMDAELEKFMKDNLSKLNEARNMLKGMAGVQEDRIASGGLLGQSGSKGTFGTPKNLVNTKLAPIQ